MLVSQVDVELVSALSGAADSLGMSVVALPHPELLDRARSSTPDLVLLHFAAKDTLELLSVLKSGQRTRGVPVVVVTEADSLEQRDLAMEVGADAVLTMPLGPGFLARLSAMLGRSPGTLRPSAPR